MSSQSDLQKLYDAARAAREKDTKRIYELLNQLSEASLATETAGPVAKVFGVDKIITENQKNNPALREQVKVKAWDGKTYAVTREANRIYNELVTLIKSGSWSAYSQDILNSLKAYNPFSVAVNNTLGNSSLQNEIHNITQSVENNLQQQENETIKNAGYTSNDSQYVYVAQPGIRGSKSYKEIKITDVPVGTEMFAKNQDGTYSSMSVMDQATKTKVDSLSGAGTVVTPSALSASVGIEQGNIYMGEGKSAIPTTSWMSTWGSLDKATQDKYISLFKKSGYITGTATVNQIIAAWGKLGDVASSAAQAGIKMDPYAIMQDISKGGSGTGSASASRALRAQARSSMLAFYANNGLPVNEEEIKNWSNKVANGGSIDDFYNLKRKTDLSKLYPDWAEHINAGVNVRELAGSYISAMAETLGLNPNEITVTDPTLQRALHYTDASGNKGLRSLYDFKLDLRKDPRWATSENGRETIANYYDTTLKMFGLKA